MWKSVNSCTLIMFENVWSLKKGIKEESKEGRQRGFHNSCFEWNVLESFKWTFFYFFSNQ